MYFLQLCDDIVHERTLVTVEQQLVLAALALQAEESGVEEGSELRLLPHIVPARLYQSLGQDAVTQHVEAQRLKYKTLDRMDAEEIYLEVSVNMLYG